MVATAWRAGLVDARAVAVIVERVGCLDLDTAQEVATDAVAYATEAGRCRTAPQVRLWLRRKVITADPAAAEVRRQRAIADRRVASLPAMTACPSCGRCCRGCRPGRSSRR